MTLEELCPDMVLDPAVLKDVDPVELTSFLIAHTSELSDRIDRTALELLSKKPPSGKAPQFADSPDFQKSWYKNWHQSLTRRVGKPYAERSLLNIFIPATVYLYDCYEVSCSKVILGCEVPTVPPKWVQAWLTEVDKLSGTQKNQLFNILSAGTIRCDSIYILKSRLEEMAVERGLALPDFLYYPGFSRKDKPAIVDGFAKTTFSEDKNEYLAMKPYLGKARMLRLIISISILYQVSPDYLLLQDYSEYATMPTGERYSVVQRAWLSKLLSVDAATRAEAIGFVMAQTAKTAMHGSEALDIINDMQATTKNGALSIRELISIAPSEWDKTQKDAFVVRKVKKVIKANFRNVPKISAAKLFMLVDGNPTFVRRALYELEKDGLIRRATDTSEVYWEITEKFK